MNPIEEMNQIRDRHVFCARVLGAIVDVPSLEISANRIYTEFLAIDYEVEVKRIARHLELLRQMDYLEVVQRDAMGNAIAYRIKEHEKQTTDKERT
jgi:hypothetical protein